MQVVFNKIRATHAFSVDKKVSKINVLIDINSYSPDQYEYICTEHRDAPLSY